MVRSHSIDELYALCSDLVDNVNENVPQETDTPPSDAGNLSYFQNFSYLQKMGKEGQKAMKGLADQYPQFKSWYPYPKPLINPMHFICPAADRYLFSFYNRSQLQQRDT